MLKKYDDFLLESLLMESILVYSDDFRKILKNVESPIATYLLDVEDVDLELSNNYIDISDKPDQISFISDEKGQKLANAKNIQYIGSNLNSYISDYFIDNVCVPLEFDTKGKFLMELPVNSSNGTILKTLNYDGKIYYKCQFDDDIYLLNSENSMIIGKTPFNSNRQDIKIGRGIRGILNSAKIKYTDSEIETFVNKYKAEIDILNDQFNNFELTSGSDIAYWYNSNRYYSDSGTLGNSCMADVNSGRFDIYCDNPDVCKLLILKQDKSKIKGRALVWKLSNGDTFMDRVYTNNDNDFELFNKYAKLNGWKRKKANDSSTDFVVVLPNGEEVDSGSLKINIKGGSFYYYPYLDTFCYYYIQNNGILSNSDDLRGDYITLCDADDGKWNEYCYDCEESGTRECGRCEGYGKVDCDECKGSCKVECSECEGSCKVECSECEGCGEIEGEDGEMVECSECEGDGKVECSECEGDGKVECSECEGDGRLECPNCDGEGEVECHCRN